MAERRDLRDRPRNASAQLQLVVTYGLIEQLDALAQTTPSAAGNRSAMARQLISAAYARSPAAKALIAEQTEADRGT